MLFPGNWPKEHRPMSVTRLTLGENNARLTKTGAATVRREELDACASCKPRARCFALLYRDAAVAKALHWIVQVPRTIASAAIEAGMFVPNCSRSRLSRCHT